MTLRGRKVSRLDPIQYQFRVFKLFLILPLPFQPYLSRVRQIYLCDHKLSRAGHSPK